MTDAEVVALLQEIRAVARESLESKWTNQFGQQNYNTALTVWKEVDWFCLGKIEELERRHS